MAQLRHHDPSPDPDSHQRPVSLRIVDRGFPPADGQQLAQQLHLRAEEDLHLQRVALDATANAIMITDTSGVIRWVNPAFTILTGYSAEETIGQTTRLLRSGGQTEAYYREMWETVSAGEIWRGELLNRRKDGSLYVEEQTITPVRDSQGRILHYVAIKQDVTERSQRARELEAMATVSAALRAAATRAEMLPVILEQICDLLRADGALIAILEHNSDEVLLERGYGEMARMGGLRVPAKDGVIGHILSTGVPYRTADLWRDPQLTRPHPSRSPEALAGAPLSAQNTPLGVLLVSRALGPEHDTGFSDAELRLLTAIADMAASAMRRAELHEQTQQRLQRLQALHNVNMAISASLDLGATLGVLLDHVIDQLRVDAASVLLFDPRTLCLEYAAGRGFRTRGIESSRITLDDQAAGRAVIERRPISLRDLHTHVQFTRERKIDAEGFTAYYTIPLIAKGYVRGVLEVFTRGPWRNDAEWEELLHILAAQATVAIDNTALFEGLQRSNLDLAMAYDATIEGWSRALDLRDKETEGHSQRVTELTVRLARFLRVDEESLIHIRRGALLHDIGKMGVPDAILLKPGPLSSEEWEQMRRHPTYAYEMLRPIDYLRPALDIPHYHHERWDGRGYPHGLAGEAIPLAARIFALADVWDALRSNRPYRQAWDAVRVRSYISAQAGSHFDPAVVRAFLDLDA
ncbi:GAF domain-containing protein [Oscillochloris sp. ZM17-4]|uniref:HD domain-containing phosphohydrolase n=1 Tax=Oscillochloris sp. ZM17-4 TaxID=2866714 RepID=UPI001C732399|nr:HD domain-containing phosphohydrolase [Oscillochloris sp. ZM17-4]MBX0328432.1 GAF domain-containing protein [Oscillochloris sp. ZM17-4]